jgi:rod shape-determining protein MreC
VLVKKTKSPGIISWDAKDPRFLILNNIPKSDSIVTGDTIVTGTYSLSIPPGKIVGTVAEIIEDKATNFFILKIRTAANFPDLQQVFIVENLQYDEQDKLLKETQKIVDDPKRSAR